MRVNYVGALCRCSVWLKYAGEGDVNEFSM